MTSSLKLTFSRIVAILIFYCFLLIFGVIVSILVLIPENQSPLGNFVTDNSILSLLGSLGMSIVGATTYYIRKIYKYCIGGIITSPADNESDKLHQLGVTAYFIIRPIFALGLSLLVVIGLKAGILTMANNKPNLSEGFIYSSMFISFFCGFSSGDLLEILEKSGNKIFSKIFQNGNVEEHFDDKKPINQ